MMRASEQRMLVETSEGVHYATSINGERTSSNGRQQPVIQLPSQRSPYDMESSRITSSPHQSSHLTPDRANPRASLSNLLHRRNASSAELSSRANLEPIHRRHLSAWASSDTTSLRQRFNLGAHEHRSSSQVNLTPAKETQVSPISARSGSLASSHARTSFETGHSSLSDFNESIDKPVSPRGLVSETGCAYPTYSKLSVRQFQASLSSAGELARSLNPPALRPAVRWMYELYRGLGLEQQTVIAAIRDLLHHTVQPLNIANAELLAFHIVSTLVIERKLVEEEGALRFVCPRPPQFTWIFKQRFCYSQEASGSESEDTDWSHDFMRPYIGGLFSSNKMTQDWPEFWNYTPKDPSILRSSPLQYQFTIRELTGLAYSTCVKYERAVCDLALPLTRHDCNVPFGGALENSDWLEFVFGHFLDLAQVTIDHFLLPLLARETKQGPFVRGISDVILDFLKVAMPAYSAAVAATRISKFLFQREESHNPFFKAYVGDVFTRLGEKLDFSSYSIAWFTFLSKTKENLKKLVEICPDEREKASLGVAYHEWMAFTEEINSQDARYETLSELQILSHRILLNPKFDPSMLALDDGGRKILCENNMFWPSGNNGGLMVVRGILLNNYLVLADTQVSLSEMFDRYHIATVNHDPIHISLLSVVSEADEAVYKFTTRNQTSYGRRNQPLGGIFDTKVLISGSMRFTDDSEAEEKLLDQLLFPFKVRHLGETTFTLFATRPSIRKEFCEKIKAARREYQLANDDPFKLRIIAESAVEEPKRKSQSKLRDIHSPALDTAIKEEKRRRSKAKNQQQTFCQAKVKCATVFKSINGIVTCAIGTSDGLYLSDYTNPGGWCKLGDFDDQKVTQIAVMYNLVFIITNGVFRVLDFSALENRTPTPQHPAPIYKKRDVSCFSIGYMNIGDNIGLGEKPAGKSKRLILALKTKSWSTNVVELYEPVASEASSKSRRSIFSIHNERYRLDEVDKFTLPSETFGLNLLCKTVAVAGSNGFHIYRPGWKEPTLVSRPDENHTPERTRSTDKNCNTANPKPLGCFGLSGENYLLAYEGVGYKVKGSSSTETSLTYNYASKAKSTCLYGRYLIVVCPDNVQIYDIVDGSRRQVIAGTNIKLIDDATSNYVDKDTDLLNDSRANKRDYLFGRNGAFPRTLKIRMQHPDDERKQIVLELLER